MRSIMLSGFAAALMLGACGNPTPAENKIDTAATAVAEETATEPTVDNAALLASILAAQPEDTQARYIYRNPAETLAFFQVEPGMTVAEALPGGGWYSKILVDYLGAEGQLIGIDYDVSMWPLFGGFATEEFIENRKSWPETWPEGAEEWRSEGSAPVSAATFSTVTDEMAGTADRVLFVRALHNMNRFEAEGGYLTQGLAAAHKILKPGGMVGVVQHRSPEDNPDDWANGSNGYLKQGAVVSVFEAAGFELVASSEINANPKDQPVEGDVVWRLPPSLSGDDEAAKEKNREIGESDRMTLLFKKV